MLTPVTFRIPLIDDETLQRYGVRQQDFIDDLAVVLRAYASKIAMQLKDAEYRQMVKQAGASDDPEIIKAAADLPNSMLPDDVREVFAAFDDANQRLLATCSDEARRITKSRQDKRDREDRVTQALRERVELDRKG